MARAPRPRGPAETALGPAGAPRTPHRGPGPRACAAPSAGPATFPIPAPVESPEAARALPRRRIYARTATPSSRKSSPTSRASWTRTRRRGWVPRPGRASTRSWLSALKGACGRRGVPRRGGLAGRWMAEALPPGRAGTTKLRRNCCCFARVCGRMRSWAPSTPSCSTGGSSPGPLPAALRSASSTSTCSCAGRGTSSLGLGREQLCLILVDAHWRVLGCDGHPRCPPQDAHGGCEKFRPLFHFFFYRVAFDSSVLQVT